jgi:NADH:ubiquinone oxidoreductase subunit 6 (subunit J)
MSLWIGLVLAVGGAALAVILRDIRRASLAVWVAGLGVGAIEMSLGAEALAVSQWVLSTVALVVFILFAVSFGEYRFDSEKKPAAGAVLSEGRFWRLARVAGPALLGFAFMGVVVFGYVPLEKRGALPAPPQVAPAATDLGAIAGSLLRENFVALEAVGLLLFLTLVGAGMVARPERLQPEDEARSSLGRDNP